jgi:hypothetical protein
MRLWSLHPRYLDRQGLLACWREALLAQKVLKGETKGYRHHPQLIRFRLHPDPLPAIATYLSALADEADRRGYIFNRTKIIPMRTSLRLPVTRGQLLYEWEHLKAKLFQRDPERHRQFAGIEMPETHPVFLLVEGERESWEKA